ncbi:hypothetical protein yc1106_06806 [Curvularia clavata]|uniref:Mediator of RNA polymerase II transcription subunit 7 n=1 Tax=Curvularia clavata TaxID=95742 RepID=A0A9Q8ZCF9_CURCL|nr:hypothetical protein yc1106_06806 [Curvularia clavata]
MADPQQPGQVEDEDIVLSFFPDPPPFYKHFTPENLERLRQIESDAGLHENNDDPTSPAAKLSPEQILALPTELRYLIPPEPPADDAEFHVFDTVAKAKGTDVFMKNMEYIADQLKMQGVFQDWQYEQLYPSDSSLTTTTTSVSSQPPTTSNSASLDRQNYLFRFLRSILLSYISLLGIVAADAVSEQKDQKLKDIMTMVANMHALINEYRPHQARQTLIERMEEQVRRKQAEIEGVRKMGEKVREVLASFGAGDTEGKDGVGDVVEEDAAAKEMARKMDAQRGAWETLEEALG